MSDNGYETRGVSVRDVRSAFDTLYEDFAVAARVVIFVRRDVAAPSTLSFVGQLVSADGSPAEGVPPITMGWPNPNHKTLTSALHWIVSGLYAKMDYELSRASGESEARSGE